MSMLHKFWNPTILDWRIRSKFGKETKENQGDQLIKANVPVII